MVNVLFVCLGNICRSTMAEAVLRHMVEEAGLSHAIKVDSAGTAGYHIGEPPHPGTRNLLREKNISTQGIRSRKLEREDLAVFDYVVGMDEDNLRGILALAKGEKRKKAFLLSDFVEDAGWTSVPDPWFAGDFGETYRLVEQGCAALLGRIRRELAAR